MLEVVYAANDPVNHIDEKGLNRSGRYLPAIRPTIAPIVLANVQGLIRQIRESNPAFRYDVIVPAGQPTYTVRDVQFLRAELDSVWTNEYINRANEPYNESGLSVVARAWEKHAGRQGGTFEPLQGNVSQKNQRSGAFFT